VPILAVALATCIPEPPATDDSAGRVADPEVLMKADRDFSDAVAEGGTAAWVSWFAEDGAQVQPGVGEIRGHDALRNAMAGLDDPDFSLTWAPDRADIAASGDLGWTTGRFVSEGRGAEGDLRRGYGRYVSIWRKQADGSWKVVMDLGNPTGAP
jgi:ketosteroid isomerase-like protein